MADDGFELNEINQLIATIQPLRNSGGDLSDPVLNWLGSAQATETPHLDHPRLSLFSANHGFADALNLPADINYENYIKGCLEGTGRINRLALAANTDLRLYEMDPDARSEDALTQPAMASSDLVRAMAYGMMSVEPGLDLIAAGAFGHGTRQSAQALIALHLDQNSDDLTVARLVRQAQGRRGLAVLEAIGGYELAALCGAVIAARLANCAALLEGEAGYAALLVLEAENPALTDHCRLCGCESGQTSARWKLELPLPVMPAAEPGTPLACALPLLRTRVILNDPRPVQTRFA